MMVINTPESHNSGEKTGVTIMDGIFISYRREESAGHAGRIYDRLREKFGKNRVFMDVSAIEPGVDFVEAIDHAVGSCAVLLVVIGRRWLECSNAAGQRRLDDPKDFIRLEVGTALRRTIRVIPVLVQNAEMPGEEALPEELKLLARRNAIEINDSHWDSDLSQLVDTLERVMAGGAGPPSPTGSVVKKEAGTNKNRLTWLISSITAVLVALAGLLAGIDSFRDSFVKLFRSEPQVTATSGQTPVATPAPSPSPGPTAPPTVSIPAAATPPPPKQTTATAVKQVVPNVVGQTLEKASSVLKKKGFSVEIAGEHASGEVPAGTVLRHFPKGGDKLERGGKVGLVMATGPNQLKLATVPNVLKQPLERAVKMLAEAGLQPGSETRRPARNIRPGTVVNQKIKPGSQVKPGSSVDLWVAVEPEIETPPAKQPGKVLAKGKLDIRQTFLFDLDEGKSGADSDADLWFEAVTATERYLTPRNGATIGLVRAADYESCSRVRMSERRIPLDKLAASVAVCLRTNHGKLASFRLREPVGPSPGVLKISYIVWE